MKKRNLGTYDLAILTNVSHKTVKRWINGTFEPRHRNLIILSDTLNVSADFLCGKDVAV